MKEFLVEIFRFQIEKNYKLKYVVLLTYTYTIKENISLTHCICVGFSNCTTMVLIYCMYFSKNLKILYKYDEFKK